MEEEEDEEEETEGAESPVRDDECGCKNVEPKLGEGCKYRMASWGGQSRRMAMVGALGGYHQSSADGGQQGTRDMT